MWNVTSGRSLIMMRHSARVPWILEWLSLCTDLHNERDDLRGKRRDPRSPRALGTKRGGNHREEMARFILNYYLTLINILSNCIFYI